MTYRLFAFDLDGTLLNDEKRLTALNLRALHDIAASGAIIAFATGRIGSSTQKYVPDTLPEVALLTLNGADVRTGKKTGERLVHQAFLSPDVADYLIEYAKGRPFALNYYFDGDLYAVRNETTHPWLELYHAQTGTAYRYVDALDRFKGERPSKIIFVGSRAEIDEQETYFKGLWGDTVYVCRTWDHYLEFLDPAANKARGLDALAGFYGIGWDEIVAFGDAPNDIPMLRKAALGIAMANAPGEVKQAASRVSPWTNNEDGIAREWELLQHKRHAAGTRLPQ